MNIISPAVVVPVYRGQHWIDADLPMRPESWLAAKDEPTLALPGALAESLCDPSETPSPRQLWVGPRRQHYFFSDLHADADAFMRSLVASGGVEKFGAGDADFDLTEEGRKAIFVIGGDCLNKGPSNLRLLRLIKRLIDKGAKVELLAGNHDLGTLTCLVYAGCSDDPLHAHLFVRLAKKSLNLFQEIHRDCVPGKGKKGKRPGKKAIRRRLIPQASWYKAFPKVAKDLMDERDIEKELKRIPQRIEQLEVQCAHIGLSLEQLDAALRRAQQMFLEPDGEFHWFFDRMQLAYRAGSCLFVHAGIDDATAGILRRERVSGLNRRFRQKMAADLCGLYYGPLGNAFHTRYGPSDRPLTACGDADLHASGLRAIVHGHRSIGNGQRIMMQGGMLNFACDASVDRTTRDQKGLEGPGAAVTVFRSDGRVLGISTDHPYVKVFDPAEIQGVA